MSTPAQDKARRLAALEASLASELTRTRTMTLAVASAARAGELEPSVAAWIADWTEYHTQRAGAQVIRDALPVAMEQISVHRVAEIVWFHHRQECTPSETVAGGGVATASESRREANAKTETPEPLTGLPQVRIPARFSPRLKASIEISGETRRVPPSVAQALLEIAEGAELVKFRKETHTAILKTLPELAAHIVRQEDRKVIANKHTYRPSEELRHCLRIN